MGRWIIQHDDYRSVIRLECKNRKISFRSICAVAHIHTSYFSRVMSGDANLSEEQLFKVGEVLGFRDWPLEYFLLLGARDRSGAKDHRSYLGHKIEEMRAKYSKVISKLDDVYTAFSDQDIGLYYQNSLTACIHMYLTIPKFASNPSLIAKRLRISEEVVAHELGLLAELGIISSSEHGEVKLLKHAVHLDEHHPASNGNHKNWRIDTLSHLNRHSSHPSDYHLSAVFSCDEATKVRIKEAFKEAIVQIQSLVNQCETPDEVYHIGLDVY